MVRIGNFLRTTTLLLAALGTALAHGDPAYPVKPIRVVLPYSAGGAIDLFARAFADAAGKTLGQNLIVDNKPGGNTFIGMGDCARSKPDGYTLCIINSDALAVGPHAFTKMPYAPTKDLVGVASVVAPFTGVFARADAPFNDFKGMLAYAKANPGKLNYGSWGSGSIAQLHLELFNQRLKADMQGIPYKGSADVLTAMLAGDVQVGYFTLGQMLPYVKEGKIRPMSISGARRAPQLPNIPTMVELGADLGIRSEFGIYAPKATPPQLVEKLNSAFVTALHDPKIQVLLSDQGWEPLGTSVDAINKAMNVQFESARAAYRDFNLKPVE